ncbi:MAG: hypothetical protein K6A89_11395 [Treponema sp.]|nr:hypothetical protein [Treponema sp.]
MLKMMRKKKNEFFDLETYDYTPYARELTEEEMYLVNGGRRMIGDRTNESEHVSSRPASSNESGSSSGTSTTSNSTSNSVPAATQTTTSSSQTNSSSQQNNTESQPQTSSVPTCTAAQMAAAQGAAMNAYFAEQDKKREENNKQNNNSGSSSSSSSSQSSQIQHNTNDQYIMAQKDYDEHYGNYTSETATDNSVETSNLNNDLFESDANNPECHPEHDGRKDIYYNEKGEWIESVDSETENIYLRINSENIYLCGKNEFIDYVAAVYGEAGPNQEEANAIADVIENRAIDTNSSISYIVANTGIYGYSQNTISAASNSLESNDETAIKRARSAVIHSYTTNIDVSGGAYFWEGLTFIDPQSPNYDSDNWYVRNGWGTTPGTESGIIFYNEIKRTENTVFMINNPVYRRQSYP